jgi:teichuronic acid biosynthesis glycosyltransferase TuaC
VFPVREAAGAALGRCAASQGNARESLRVLFVIPGEGPGDGHSMIFARRQAEALRARNIQVYEFFLESRTSLRALARELRRFRAEVRAASPELVHAHFGTVTALFAALGGRGLPLVITYRGSDLNPSPGGSTTRASKGRALLARLFSQVAALRARRIVCVSSQLRERLWWRRSRATVLPTGVDTGEFQARPRDMARRKLEWPESVPVVLFHAGKEERIKRLDLALASMSVARRMLPDVRLEVLDGSVPPERMPAFMNAADCLLVTSDFEGSPTVVQEALASNLPIVSVDVGDVRQRIDRVSNTRLVDRDPGAIGRALVEMVRIPLRTDGWRKVSEFRMDAIAARVHQLYLESLRRQ